MDLCRLCTGVNNVVDVFNSQLEYGERLRQCVLLATGVNIKKDDIASTMICRDCLEVTRNFYKFRIGAIRNDAVLKYNCDQSVELPDSDIEEIKKAVLALYSNVKDSLLDNINSEINQLKLKLNITESSEEIRVPTPKKHPSVVKLHRDYKNLILPDEVYNDNISPVVTLDTNDVTDWYSEHAMSSKNLSETDNCITRVDESHRSSPEENSFISDINSSDSDSEFLTGTVQLRNRTYRRILFESDSEDDSPRKKTPKKTTILSEKIQIVHDRLSDKLNSRTKNTQLQQPSIAFITVNHERFGTISDVRRNFDSLEFKDYGIHFENIDDIDKIDTIILSNQQVLSSTEPSDGIDTKIELLFKKFYHCQINMCGGPNEEYVIQNIASEIKKYWIPIELHYVNENHMEPVRESLGLNIDNDTFWMYQECVDIQKPRYIRHNQFRRLENPGTSNSIVHLPIADTIIIDDSDDETNYDHLTIDANVSDGEEPIIIDDVPSPTSTISYHGDNQFLLNPHSRAVTNPILSSEYYGLIPQTSFAHTQNELGRYLLPTQIPTPLLEYERQQSSVFRNGVFNNNNNNNM